jgi:tripartite-type tricarboxylate transporter receptor subunit TctC
MWARRLIAGVLPAAVMVLGASGVSGQDYPSKPIRIYANQPGGAFEFFARVYSQGLKELLGQPVIVDNRAGNIIPAEIVSKSPPDGYSLLSHGVPLAFGAFMQKMPYDPMKNFQPISSDGERAAGRARAPVGTGKVRAGVDRSRQGQAGSA